MPENTASEVVASPELLPVKLTPLMAQYWDIKAAHEDKILLFRMGDFFEMFQRDAEIAAPVIGIALTSRNKKSPDETRMCGVPVHSVANAINKLLGHGFKVAICDQIEDPKFAKGLVKRAVTRILSPGVVYDPDMVDSLRANYLASVDQTHVSFLDTTTGEAFYFHVKDPLRRDRLIRSLGPVEIVVSASEKTDIEERLKNLGLHQTLVSVHSVISENSKIPESARRLLAYAVHMQGEKILATLEPFTVRELLDRMELPATVVRHLEMFETYKGDAKGTLFFAVNRAKTSMGARHLRQWLQFPLLNEDAIARRHDQVGVYLRSPEKLKELRSVLGGLGDIQRRLGKLGSPSVNPRDLQALAESLKVGLEVCALAHHIKWDAELIACAEATAQMISSTLVDEPPIQLKNGGIVRKGVDARLDELIELSTDASRLLIEMEAREREATGISSLKIRFNNVFGYYIEITHTHKDKVPTSRYERKQTLANAERYMTKELSELEAKVLSAQSKRLELEVAIFDELVAQSLRAGQKLLRLAHQWAELDVLSSFAWLALEQNYVRPSVQMSGDLSIKASRHPVIEQALDLPFIANDITIARGSCLLLTGPNMAGKSTLMRQVACAAILAQAGCFVPATEARLPIFKQIFTRIGASDFLSEGLSTFMVEMKETAEMLESADESSLVVLDEVGRGTSTYDGMSLAQAILEFLLENRKSMTLFATHYHELTELATVYPQLVNAHMSIHERAGKHGAEIVFLHQLALGPANKSYGIHVGKLAGLPTSVVKRAALILKKLEVNKAPSTPQMSLLGLVDRMESADLIDEDISEENLAHLPVDESLPLHIQSALDELKGIDVSRLTPIEALNQIAKWQQSLS